MKYLKLALSHSVAIGIAIVVSIIAYQSFHDPKVAAERGRLVGQLQRDSADFKTQLAQLKAEGAKVDTVQRVVTNTVTKWQKEIVHDTIVLPATATPHDTIVATQKKLDACKQVGGDVVASVVPLGTTCEAFKAKAQTTIKSLEQRYAHLDSLNRLGSPPKRWNLSLSIGYGYATRLDSIAPRRELFAGLTVGRTLFSR
jgi:hypothetical protein